MSVSEEYKTFLFSYYNAEKRSNLNKELLDSLFPDYYIFYNKEFLTLKNEESSYIRGYIEFDTPRKLSVLHQVGHKIAWIPYTKDRYRALSYFALEDNVIEFKR